MMGIRAIWRYLAAKAWLIPIVLIIATLPTFATLMRPGYFWMQDDLQAFRVLEMFKCFQDWQLPCRWVPDPGYQYGYPQFLFYPPSVYYIGALIHLTGLQVIDSVKILFAAGFILSALSMYFFTKDWLGKWPAIVTALVYTYVPYKAVEVYVRGALSEFWALVIYPLVFWAIWSIFRNPNKKNIGLLALSTGFLLLTHNLMSLLFAPFILGWTTYWWGITRKNKNLMLVIFGLVLGVGLAVWFSFPIAMERQYVHLETLVGGYFDYRAHFVDIRRLFLSNHWGYGSSGIGQDNDLSLSVGIAHWVLALMAVGLGIVIRKDKKISGAIVVLALMSLISAFMIHQKSSFIWSLVPSLEFVQFPWRFLGVNIFINSLLAGLGVYVIGMIKPRLSYYYGIVSILLAVGLTLSFFHPKEWYLIRDNDKFSGVLWEKQLTISIFDYLPVYAKFPPVHKAPELPEVLEGSVVINNYTKGTNWQSGQLTADMPSVIRLPIYDYPGMKVYLNDEEINHVNNDCRGEEFCLGLVTIEIKPGNYKLTVRLEDTGVRRWSLVISGMVLIIVLWLVSHKK